MQIQISLSAGPTKAKTFAGPKKITLKSDWIYRPWITAKNPWAPSTPQAEKKLLTFEKSAQKPIARKGLVLTASGATYAQGDVEYKAGKVEISLTPKELKKYVASGDLAIVKS